MTFGKGNSSCSGVVVVNVGFGEVWGATVLVIRIAAHAHGRVRAGVVKRNREDHVWVSLPLQRTGVAEISDGGFQ